MVYNRKTTAEERELIRFLYMEKRYSLREIAQEKSPICSNSNACVKRISQCFKEFANSRKCHLQKKRKAKKVVI